VRESGNGQVKISNRTIICWALVEFIGEDDALQTEVRGVEQKSNHLVIVGDLIETDKIGKESVDENEYFLGYNDPEAPKSLIIGSSKLASGSKRKLTKGQSMEMAVLPRLHMTYKAKVSERS
jgi:hypothetical protein